MNIKKVDDKPMVIHTKEKPKVHVKGTPETKIKGQEYPYRAARSEDYRKCSREKRGGRREDKVKKEFRPCYG